jgi:hypothetical protein
MPRERECERRNDELISTTTDSGYDGFRMTQRQGRSRIASTA